MSNIVFKSDRYVITKVSLNWAIDVKVMTKGNKLHEKVKLLPERLFIPLDRSLEYAKEAAEYYIDKYEKLALLKDKNK